MSDEAQRLWQEKLELLLAEEAKAFDPAVKFKIREDIAEAKRKLEELIPAVRSEPDSAEPIEPKWTDELRIYGEGFAGRKEELEELDRAWAKGVRIFVLHAEGGAGKTRVVVEWLRRMRDNDWRGARRIFVHSFYSQGSDERRNASSELFFEQALAYFGYHGERITQADEKGRTLARLLIEHHGLLVLDGLEPLQHPPVDAEQGRLKDPGIARLLLSLASVGRISTPTQDETRSLCLITSRQPVIELQGRTGATVIQEPLDQLHRNDGANLLKEFQVLGPDEELRQASDEFHGHAYSLMLLGSYLKNATDHHDICRRREVVLLEEDTEHRSHARRMFAVYVRHLGEQSSEVAVLRLLGFFDRAAERQLLDVLRARETIAYDWSDSKRRHKMWLLGIEGRMLGINRSQGQQRIEDSVTQVTAPLLDLSQAQWHRVLNRLRDLRLTNFSSPGTSSGVDAHPLLREYFAEQVRIQFPLAWQAGHQRLAEHLAGSAPYRPDGIAGLQPLYQAVAHCCLAGLHQQACDDIYRDRILRGTDEDGFYSKRKLGAIGADLGAEACFFTTKWTILTPNLSPSARAFLLGVTAFDIRTLGRLTEALDPIRLALKNAIDQEKWRSAAIRAVNLSELEVKRGEIPAGVAAGRQSITYAALSGDDDQQNFINSRTTLADALHQAGRRDESYRLFEDAERRQAEYQPEFPRLYSVGGFRYCDLLLSEAERAAWQCYLLAPVTASLAACDSINERAIYTLRFAESKDLLLEIALDHLTLARAALYKAHFDQPIPRSARHHFTAAISGLLESGQMDDLPFGLLTRAWLRRLSGDEPGCRADLEEAWEITERGPMPLFQADIQLYRARLFRDREALEEARRLIEKHGYHRRDEELADALEAAKGW